MAGVTRSQPRALGYAETTTNVTGITSAAADVTAVTVTFTPQRSAVVVEFGAGLGMFLTLAGVPTMTVTDGSNVTIARADGGNVGASASSPAISGRKRVTVTPGTSYTWKVRVSATNATGGNAGTIFVGATAPAYIRVAEE